MTVNLVVAADENNGIGKKNQLPWHLPADLKFFKTLTTGNPIIMGRKTFDSIGKVLPNRRNIVISRQNELKIPGGDVAPSLDEALNLCKNENNVFVIGGAQIFNEALPIADILYLTRIHHNFKADTFFPEIEKDHWVEIDRKRFEPDEKNAYPYTFIKYRKA